MPLNMKLGVMTPDEWLQNTVGQANKNKGNSSSSSKKPSSNPAKSSSSKNNGVFTGNFAKDFETRKNIQKKQNSYGAKLGKAAYDTQAKRLQDKIDSARDGNARTRYQNQLAELRARANATLPGGLAGMEEAEERETSAAQRRAPGSSESVRRRLTH